MDADLDGRALPDAGLGRDVRAKDVALLFADAATGAHSPALVSQGRIAAVISARPVERRQDALTLDALAWAQHATGAKAAKVKPSAVRSPKRKSMPSLAFDRCVLCDHGGRLPLEREVEEKPNHESAQVRADACVWQLLSRY